MKWLIPAIKLLGGLKELILAVLSYATGYKQGASKVIEKQQSLDVLELNNHFIEREKIRRIHANTDNVYLSLSIPDLNLLRENGYTSMSQITDAVNSGVLRRLKGEL